MFIFWRTVKWVAAIWLLLVAIGFFSAAFAQALPATVFQQTVVGNVTTFGGATATAANASSLTFGAAANGPLYATSQQSIALGGGRTATATVKTFPDALATSKAIGRFASKVATPLVVGVALYDLAKELGYTFDRSNGSLVVKKSDPSVCTVGPCYRYFVNVAGFGTNDFPQVWQSTPDAACQASGDVTRRLWASLGYGAMIATTTGVSPSLKCSISGVGYAWIARREVSPSSADGAPSTLGSFEQDVASSINSVPSASALPRVLSDVLASGEEIPLPKPAEITGPPTVELPPEVVTNPDGSTVTTTPRKDLQYGPDSVTVTDGSTKVFRDAAGNVTGTSTTSKPAELPDIKTCGYPGGPPCKIDEAGTPDAKPEEAYKQGADDYKAKVDQDRAVIQGTSDKPFFQGWDMFFSAPPIAACEPIVLPDYQGAPMGSINPCGTADAIRQVMAWLWALGGLWLCLGWIREVV